MIAISVAVVRHLVELHGGTVEASSDGVGKGARFTVRLPRLHVRIAAEETGGRGVRVAVNTLRGAKILVVDDEDDVRSYAAAVFRMSGSDVRCVHSADEAVELLGRWQADVVVSDLGMPERDGFDLLRAIRASSTEPIANVPVVALTAYAHWMSTIKSQVLTFRNTFVDAPDSRGTVRAFHAATRGKMKRRCGEPKAVPQSERSGVGTLSVREAMAVKR